MIPGVVVLAATREEDKEDEWVSSSSRRIQKIPLLVCIVRAVGTLVLCIFKFCKMLVVPASKIHAACESWSKDQGHSAQEQLQQNNH